MYIICVRYDALLEIFNFLNEIFCRLSAHTFLIINFLLIIVFNAIDTYHDLYSYFSSPM